MCQSPANERSEKAVNVECAVTAIASPRHSRPLRRGGHGGGGGGGGCGGTPAVRVYPNLHPTITLNLCVFSRFSSAHVRYRSQGLSVHRHNRLSNPPPRHVRYLSYTANK
ncbi:unnamed protein product [Haemonchus placei]|uniref:Uncharacterized protein n=1 Tax=Haemonchus placei TaxID=6290 RepID=A0A0N4VXW6_HAEPC|nr:unnamed protein product [Haemonchus placei]